MSVELLQKEFAGTFVCFVASNFNDEDIVNVTFLLEWGFSDSITCFDQFFFDAWHTYFSEFEQKHLVVRVGNGKLDNDLWNCFWEVSFELMRLFTYQAVFSFILRRITYPPPCVTYFLLLRIKFSNDTGTDVCESNAKKRLFSINYHGENGIEYRQEFSPHVLFMLNGNWNFWTNFQRNLMFNLNRTYSLSISEF